MEKSTAFLKKSCVIKYFCFDQLCGSVFRILMVFTLNSPRISTYTQLNSICIPRPCNSRRCFGINGTENSVTFLSWEQMPVVFRFWKHAHSMKQSNSTWMKALWRRNRESGRKQHESTRFLCQLNECDFVFHHCLPLVKHHSVVQINNYFA